MKLLEKISKGSVYVIAEMSANHAGSLECAKEIVYAAKESGADCIKTQTYTPDTMTIDCDNQYFNIGNGTWSGENLYQLYQKAYTPWEWQKDLKEEAEKAGIDFLSTPFDPKSVDFLEDLGVEFYKIASFELVDIPLIEYVAAKNKPIILSTGMGSVEEIRDAVEAVKKHMEKPLFLLRCASAYPAISASMNLNTMVDMKEKFGVQVGLSDHSMGYVGAIGAVAMGASIIEKHFCLNRKIKTPDSSFSMEPNEFAEMVNAIRQMERAKGEVFYGSSEEERSSLVFRRSIFAVENIKTGEFFSEKNIRIIRPGYGELPKYLGSFIGKRANCDIERGTPLKRSMIKE